ncbi:beta strand repeat-containing protein [Nocardioides sp.]|uniref:beta strand repeat-containing protein n=3 Tax=Nocardioides sp. TaxID=35761 RepID=UPI003D13DE1F
MHPSVRPPLGAPAGEVPGAVVGFRLWLWTLLLSLLSMAVGSGLGAPAARAAVPNPTPNTAVITVKVGGDRTGVNGVTPLQGVRLGLWTQAGAKVTTAWGECVSDVAGDCSFVVPDTQVGGVNRDVRFEVRQISVPTGWYMNPTLRTGSANGSGSVASPYQFFTGVALQANTVYRSGIDFMSDPNPGLEVANDSLGVWQQSRANNALPQQCGIDVALILDLSTSMGAAGIAAQRAAADSFVDALVGTPSRAAIFSFSNWSPGANGANFPNLVPLSTQSSADAFKAQYAGWSANGGTNWDRGLASAAEATPNYDLAILLTDGSPSLRSDPLQGTSNVTNFSYVEPAIFSANALKNKGTRILAFGVGPGVTGLSSLNLRAVSGPQAYTGANGASADYFQAADFASAGGILTDLAAGLCQGSVSVVKQIVPTGNTGENIAGSTPAPAGWQFTGTTTTAGVTGLPSTQTTTNDGTGAAQFPLGFPGGVTSAAVTVKEAQQTGYQIVTQGGANAVCTNLATGAAVSVTNDNSTPGNPGFRVNAPADAAVSCTVYNRLQPPNDPKLTLDKRVASVTDVNGNGLTDAGDRINWVFEVTNTGDVPLTAVGVTDALAGTVTCPATTLAPGASTLCTASPYGITQADVNAGNVHNTATAHGTPPTGPPVVTPPDTTDTPTDQVSRLTLDKRVASVTDVNGNGLTDAGDRINWVFEVTNTGDVPLTTVGVTDALAGPVTCPATTLAPGASTLCAAAPYVITPADVNAGNVHNTATAHGTPPTGPPVVTPPDTTDTPTDQVSRLTPDKRVASVTDVNGNGLTDAGDRINWVFEVTNTGNVTLTAAGVIDPLAGTVTCPVTTLAPAVSTLCTAVPYVITQADVNAGSVTNVATAHGTPPTGPPVVTPPDTTITPTSQVPGLVLDKRVASVTDVNGNGLTDAGDEIDYEFELTNTGNVTLANVDVSDPLVGAVTCPVTTLAAGASTVCTADNAYVITAADVQAGSVHNRAIGHGTPPTGPPTDTPPDTTDTPTDQVPGLMLDKRVVSVSDVNGNGLTDAGDEIDWVFELTNTGNVTLTDVAVDDPLAGSVTCPVTTLAPGDSTVCAADNAYVITAADVDAGVVHNRATAAGEGPGGDPNDPADDVPSNPDTTDTPTDQDPKLALDKRVSSVADVNGNGLTDAGDEINYEFELTNTGNVTLTDVAVDDPLAGSVTCPVTTLAPGDSTVCAADNAYVITAADVDAGVVHNRATAAGEGPGGDPNDPADDVPSNPDTTDTPTDQDPKLALDKRVSSVADVNSNGLTDAGDEINYEFELTNTGNVTLTNVSVSDPLVGAVTCPVTTLAPGDSTVCTADAAYVITAADVDAGNVHNRAIGHGTPPTGPPTDTPPDTTDTPTDQDPKLALDKRVASVADVNGNGLTDAGDEINWEFELTNTGNVTLSHVNVSDPLAGAVTCPVTALAAGASTVCTADSAYVITQADVDAGSVVNVATGQGTPPTGPPTDTPPDTTTTPTDLEPGLVLDKRVVSVADVNGNGLTDAGDEIDWEFEVSNTGTVTLTNVSVSDPLVGPVTCPVSTLAPGDSTVCTADNAYVITAADVDSGTVHNIATSQGTPPTGPPVVSPPDTTDTPTDQEPELALDKRVSSVTDVNGNGLTDAGDEIDYEFELTNTGNVTLANVDVSDPLVGAVTCPVATLAPGDSTVCTADNAYVITAADVDAGNVHNTATAHGTPPTGPPVITPPDTTDTPTDQDPKLALDKRVSSVTDVNGNGLTDAGDEIDWVFELTNTGNVTLTDVAVDDPLAGSVTCPVTTLAPGDSTVCAADNAYVITAADVDAGVVHNRATAAGEGPGGDPNDPADDVPSNPDTTDTPTDQDPKLALDKRVASVTDVNGNGLTDAGDEITWEFELTNTGNVTLTHPGVRDPLAGAVICPAGSLAPDASVICHPHAPYVITLADVDAGSVINVATGHGTPPTGPPVDTPPDMTTTPTDQEPGLSLDKRVGSVTDVNGNGRTDAGDRIDYEFELTNTGTVTLTDLAVSDPMIGSVTCPAAPLRSGDSVVCTGDHPHVITAADVAAGHVRNTATATGSPPGDTAVDSPPDTVTTQTDPPNPPNLPTQPGGSQPPFPQLPNTGGPAVLALLLGVVLLVVGVVATVGSRRRRG